jgi:hypothetical protein
MALLPLPLPPTLLVAALAFLGTLVVSRLAIQLRLPAVIGVLGLAFTAIQAMSNLPGLGEAQVAALEHQVPGLIFLVLVGSLCLQGLGLPPLCCRLGLAEAC